MKHNLSAHTISMLILSSALFAGCSSDDGDNVENNDNPLVPIELSRTEAEVSTNINDFSIKLFKAAVAINGDEKNTLISPLGAAIVSGMFGNAIAPEDRGELMNALNITDISALNSYCSTMFNTLPNLDNTATLSIANSSWFDNKVILHDSYRTILEQEYNSEITLADFSSPSTLSDINSWSSNSTNGAIPKFWMS